MRIWIVLITALFCTTAQCEIYNLVDKETGEVTYTDYTPRRDSSSKVEKVSDRLIIYLGESSGNYSDNKVLDSSASRKVSAEQAFNSHLSNVQISGSGTVKKLLPQDNKGSRHQKFILQLVSGQTLLIAHNIDIAPEISNLSVGDKIEFFGEYEWNEKGGVIHWTHHDPDGSHIAGWIRHGEQIYQ